MKNKFLYIVLVVLLIFVLPLGMTGCQKEKKEESQDGKEELKEETEEIDDVTVSIKSVLPIQQDKNWLMLFELSEKMMGKDQETIYNGVVIEVSDGLEIHRYEELKAYQNAGGRLAVEIPYSCLFPGSYLNNGIYQITVKAGRICSEDGQGYQLSADYTLKHLGNNAWGEKDSTKTVEKATGKEVVVEQVTASYQDWEPRWYFELHFSEAVAGEKYVTAYEGLRVLVSKGTQVKEYALGDVIGNQTNVMTGPEGRMTVLIYSEEVLPGENNLNMDDNWSITFEKGVLTTETGNLHIKSDYTLKYNGKDWIPQK